MTILLIIAGIIALFFVIALVSGKQMKLERSIIINKPAQEVFDYIRLMKNHDNFNVWMMMDPDMKREFRGIDRQEGFVYVWDSTKKSGAGAGEQETTGIVPGKSVEYEIRFIRPMEGIAKAKIDVAAAGPGQTNVHWQFDSPMKFPMNALKPIFESSLSKNMQQSLTNLRNIMEK